jgi:hypothetical protein
MTILGSGNVGIGVASPTANLHVAGISILGRSPSSYTGTSASAVLGNSTNSPNIVFEAPTFATLGWNNGIFSFGTCSNSTCSGGSPYFSIDTTTNMATFSNTNAVRAGNGNGNPAAPTYSFSTSTASGMYSPAANNLSFATTSNERMRIDASGNVGIGTASPSFTLDVQSSASFQGRFLHSSNNQYDGSAIMMTRTRGTLASNTAVTSGDTIGGMYFRAHDGSGTGTTNSSVEVSAGENHSGTNRGTYMIFETTTNGSAARSEKMRIHSNGFVGIVTTAPAGRLHVQQSANDENNGVLLSNTGGTGNTAIFVDSSNRTHFGGKTASPNAIVIDNSSGNVGIGITAPGVSLDVVSAVATPLRLRNSGYPGTYWQVGPESTSNAFVIYNTGGTGMYITSGSTTWTANSDRRIKRDIELIPKSLTKLNQINGVTYWYKTDAENEPRRVGVIAQDVQKVLPEAVSEKDGILGVRYQELIPLVINALKELYAEFKTQSSEQNRKIASLEEENLRLKAEIQDTKKAVCEINPQAKICK